MGRPSDCNPCCVSSSSSSSVSSTSVGSTTGADTCCDDCTVFPLQWKLTISNSLSDDLCSDCSNCGGTFTVPWNGTSTISGPPSYTRCTWQLSTGLCSCFSAINVTIDQNPTGGSCSAGDCIIQANFAKDFATCGAGQDKSYLLCTTSFNCLGSSTLTRVGNSNGDCCDDWPASLTIEPA